jgi:hypothetical protein
MGMGGFSFALLSLLTLSIPTIAIDEDGIKDIATNFVIIHVVLVVIDAILLLHEYGRYAPLHPGEAEYRSRQVEKLGGYARRVYLKFERWRLPLPVLLPLPMLSIEEEPTQGDSEHERRVAAV